jgi:small ligand-binding sensory domain FIST
MRWASSISTEPLLHDAISECEAMLRAELDGLAPDLVLVFTDVAFDRQIDSLAEYVADQFPGATVIGCNGAGVMGGGQEIQATPALSMTAAHLPGVVLAPFHLSASAMPSPDDAPDAWEDRVGAPAAADPQFILLADPFTFDGEALLAGLDYAFPAAAKVGGLASGGSRPGSHSLYLNGVTHKSGAVGVALSGDIIVDTVVAQGCRPIGHSMRVTSTEENMLLTADDRPPLEELQDLFEHANERDKELMQHNLFMGVAMDPLLDEAGPGDFLIRNIVGADSKKGAVAVGGALREGLLVQFHVRDAETSADDLRDAFATYLRGVGERHATAALMFQCTGRGSFLYGREGHDTDMFNELIGALPMGGFFCNGEIGPVGGTTYLHGYTSSFAIFRERTVDEAL